MYSEKAPFRVLQVHFAFKASLLLIASYGCAIYLNAATSFWQFIEAAPVPLREAAINGVLFVSQPFQPTEVHAQEELLELWLVWLFSAPATIALLVLTYQVGRRMAARARRPLGTRASAAK